ncbi:hypothetical protein THAOC_31139 [Thalassiosira oceanica]|uniref:Uncharacterized protein n=1 Tax=Thalassiosira oceanica TaxID=159749 RepID=K0R9V5_THAOC|nr:hypothetical protein THAOC_31139 [Thalassiosira oceanica]|eukprot:EJK49935.1 hypothetical protein THAOC_31139 [Thalassiosira oceanica]
MPSRKKLKDKGKGKQKRGMRQLANATPAEIIRGIHEGKPGATLALVKRFYQSNGLPYDELERDGVIEAMLKNLKRCDESLASVFGVSPSDQDMICLPYFCLSALLTVGRQSHNRQEVYLQIAEGISPVIKCMDSPQIEQDSQEAIISAAHSICGFLLQEHQNFGIPAPKAFEMLKTMGTFTIAKDPTVIGMIRLIRLYRDMCHNRDMTTNRSRTKLTDINSTLIWGDCVDETVMKELADLRDISPEFVARCARAVMILYKHSNVLSDSHFAGALRSGLLTTTLSICAQLGSQDVNPVIARTDDLVIRADTLAPGIVDRLYKIRLHHKTSKVLGSMTPLIFQGMEDKLEHIFREARESVCANCLEAFDKKELKWCEGTHMLEPFCSKKCLKESWDAGVCADFSDIVEEDDDKRSISLKRNILQAGSRVLHGSIGSIVGEHGLAIAGGQGLTITIDLREFPPRVSSMLLPMGDPSKTGQVTLIAEDFRGFKVGVKGKVLELRKRFLIDFEEDVLGFQNLHAKQNKV